MISDTVHTGSIHKWQINHREFGGTAKYNLCVLCGENVRAGPDEQMLTDQVIFSILRSNVSINPHQSTTRAHKQSSIRNGW